MLEDSVIYNKGFKNISHGLSFATFTGIYKRLLMYAYFSNKHIKL